MVAGSLLIVDIVTRRVRPAEWAVLRQVRLAALTDSPGAFASTLDRELGRSAAEWRRLSETAAWFLAWKDGPERAVAGLVATMPRLSSPTAPADARPGDWSLLSMWVSPDARGTGAAGRLVGAAAGAAAGAGGDRLLLWVADGNDRARAFYLRAGFRPTGARQRYRRQDGSALDEEEMAMPLPLTGDRARG